MHEDSSSTYGICIILSEDMVISFVIPSRKSLLFTSLHSPFLPFFSPSLLRLSFSSPSLLRYSSFIPLSRRPFLVQTFALILSLSFLSPSPFSHLLYIWCLRELVNYSQIIKINMILRYVLLITHYK